MKRFVALGIASFALAAGSAHAAGGCSYGKQQAAMASAHDAVEESAVQDETDPKLLAALKARDAAEGETVEIVVVPN